MEDDLIFFVNGRNLQLICKWKSTSFFCKWTSYAIHKIDVRYGLLQFDALLKVFVNNNICNTYYYSQKLLIMRQIAISHIEHLSFEFQYLFIFEMSSHTVL